MSNKSICVGQSQIDCPDIEPKGFCKWREASGTTRAHCRQNSNMAPLLLETIQKINTLVVNFKEGKGDKEDYNELIKNHRYIYLLTTSGKGTDNKRILTGIQLLTTQSMIMFLLAVFYDLEGPEDDGTCEFYETNSTCLEAQKL